MEIERARVLPEAVVVELDRLGVGGGIGVPARDVGRREFPSLVAARDRAGVPGGSEPSPLGLVPTPALGEVHERGEHDERDEEQEEQAEVDNADTQP